MSLYIDQQTGRIIFSNSDGTPTFDSARRNLLVTDFVQKSFTVSPVNNVDNASAYLRTQTIVLSTVHALATVVMGTHEAGGKVRSIGGTRIVSLSSDNMDPTGAYRIYLTGERYLCNGVWYHFEVSSGQLRVVINYRFCAGAQTPFGGETVKVCAWVGTFDY